MAGNSIGEIFRVTTWGESHGPAIGATVDGCPAGLELDADFIQKELERRRGGQSAATTQRAEPDRVEICSGVFEGYTTGTPISLLIRNVDADSTAYEEIKDLYRPGHADYTYEAKYGRRDHRGGGRASGRETAARVAAGAVAKTLLREDQIIIYGYTLQVGEIKAGKIDFDQIELNPLRCPDNHAAAEMEELVEKIRAGGDSLGGVVGVTAQGVPPGLGEPVFHKLDADLAGAVLSIGGVKGVEFGIGFDAAEMYGSQVNDPMVMKEKRVGTITNNHGGILGGISSGEDIVLRIAVKPTSSIAKTQKTVDREGREREITVKGRHDPTICPRIVPVAEAMTAIVLADHLLRNRSSRAESGEQ